MRFAEGPSHGFFTLSDATSGKKLAHGELVRTWAEFEDRAARLAHVLDAHGVGHDDKVALALYNGNGGTVYSTINLSGAIPNQCVNFGAVSVPVAGIQNGSASVLHKGVSK